MLVWKLFIIFWRGGKDIGWDLSGWIGVTIRRQFFLDPLISVSSSPDPQTWWHLATRHPNIWRSFPYLFAQTSLFHASHTVSPLPVNFHIFPTYRSLFHAMELFSPLRIMLRKNWIERCGLRWKLSWINKILKLNIGVDWGKINAEQMKDYFQWWIDKIMRTNITVQRWGKF